MASKPAAGWPSEVGGDRHRKSNSGKVALQGNDLPKPGVTPNILCFYRAMVIFRLSAT